MTLGLAFSGGKDSLACWYLMRHRDPIVFWCDTGKSYPETRAIVDEVRAKARRFVTVESDRAAQNDAHGIPSDLIPFEWTAVGASVTRPKPFLIQSSMQCCYDNIAAPIMRAARAAGVTQLIVGQRSDEAHRSAPVPGNVVDGIERVYPVEHWSRQAVLDYVRSERGSLPAHFEFDHTSLDCFDCTAFAAQSQDRIEWMRGAYPALYADYAARRDALVSAITPTYELLVSHAE